MRLLLGMYALDWQLRKELLQDEREIWDAGNKKARRLRAKALKKFRNQLMTGVVVKRIIPKDQAR